MATYRGGGGIGGKHYFAFVVAIGSVLTIRGGGGGDRGDRAIVKGCDVMGKAERDMMKLKLYSRVEGGYVREDMIEAV